MVKTILVRNRLYLEKLEEIDDKIAKVNEGNAPEYLHPQKELQRTLSRRMATAEAHLLNKVHSSVCVGVGQAL